MRVSRFLLLVLLGPSWSYGQDSVEELVFKRHPEPGDCNSLRGQPGAAAQVRAMAAVPEVGVVRTMQIAAALDCLAEHQTRDALMSRPRVSRAQRVAEEIKRRALKPDTKSSRRSLLQLKRH